MSKIEDLIQKLCPQGVSFRSLKEVTVSLPKGTLTTEQLIEDGKYPVINSGRTFYGFYNDYNNEGNAITVASRGEYAGFVNYSSTRFWAGGLCYPFRSINEKRIITKFIYYCLKKDESYFRHTLVAEGSIPALNKSDLEKHRIPIPPIEVQIEIIRLLDLFSEANDNLLSELRNELNETKKQQSYYKESLFLYDKSYFKPIGSFANLCAGATPSTSKPEYWEDGTIRWMSSGEVNLGEVFDTEKRITQLGYDNSSTKLLPKNTVVIALAGQGKTRGTVAITRVELCTNQSLCGILPNSTVNPDYLRFYLQTQYQKLREVSAGDGTRGGLNLKMISAFMVPVPSLEEQEKIVTTLSNMDKKYNELFDCLTKELNAHQKRYNYYCEEILTFKELNA